VEKGIDYLTRSWWTSAAVATPAQAQSDLDRWCISTADGRRRSGATVGALADAEPLLALPGAAWGHPCRRRGAARPAYDGAPASQSGQAARSSSARLLPNLV